MNLCNINHSFNYETEKLCRLFLPFEKINIIDYVEPAEIYAVAEIKDDEAKVFLSSAGTSRRICIIIISSMAATTVSSALSIFPSITTTSGMKL